MTPPRLLPAPAPLSPPPAAETTKPPSAEEKEAERRLRCLPLCC